MVLAHTMDNWAREMYAEDGIYVHQMKDHREQQEPVPPNLRHGAGGRRKGVDVPQERRDVAPRWPKDARP